VDLDADNGNGIVEVDCDAVTPDVEIVMEDTAFVDPDGEDQTTISTGEIVRWTNNDAVDHTVTSGSPDDDQEAQGELFDSGELAEDETYCLQFDEVGEFEYFSRTAPNEMRDATITVE
jgi:plastocyanin